MLINETQKIKLDCNNTLIVESSIWLSYMFGRRSILKVGWGSPDGWTIVTCIIIQNFGKGYSQNSVWGISNEEIVIQGSFKENYNLLLQTKWSNISAGPTRSRLSLCSAETQVIQNQKVLCIFQCIYEKTLSQSTLALNQVLVQRIVEGKK